MADKIKTSLNLDSDLMQKLKIVAAANNRSISDELEEAIRKHIEVNIKKVRDLLN